jgi:hypothetical protein
MLLDASGSSSGSSSGVIGQTWSLTHDETTGTQHWHTRWHIEQSRATCLLAAADVTLLGCFDEVDIPWIEKKISKNGKHSLYLLEWLPFESHRSCTKTTPSGSSTADQIARQLTCKCNVDCPTYSSKGKQLPIINFTGKTTLFWEINFFLLYQNRGLGHVSKRFWNTTS